LPPANSWELNMKKIAAGVGVVALVVVAQIALADDTARTSTQSGSSMTITGDACAGWTKGGGAAVGKTSASSSSSMDASTSAACAAAASSNSSASSSSGTSPQAILKTKTKSNQSND
jgi:hypothetical protein